jgi:hypothetical protein
MGRSSELKVQKAYRTGTNSSAMNGSIPVASLASRDSRGEVAVTTRILKEAFTISCGSNCRGEDNFVVVQFRFVMKHIAGTVEAAEIGTPGIQEPGRNDGLHLYARAIGDSL